MLKLAVFGYPIDHSKSPIIHQAFAAQYQLIIDYQKIEADLTSFKEKLKQFINAGGIGCNVTLPLKTLAYKLADEATKECQLAQAANTLSMNQHQHISAANTDGLGLVKDLIQQGIPLQQQRILILGAGGASRGIILPLLAQNPNNIHIANRSVLKAKEIYQEVQQRKLSYSDLQHIPKQTYDLIINTSSASLQGKLPAIEDDFYRMAQYCYDLVYQQGGTVFNHYAQQLNSKIITVDGLGMLVEQAAVSFALWTGKQPETASVLAQLKKERL